MDKATSVTAALRAGKQPSQSQTNAWIEKLLQCDLIQIEKTDDVSELSQNGKKLARDLRAILEAYKGYISQKNGENLFQKAVWHLSQADIAVSSLDIGIPVDSKEVSSDYRALIACLRTSFETFWNNAATEGFGVLSDFASFARLSLADAAELVAVKSSKVAEKLRNVEGEVQSGERNTVGIKEQTKEEWENADAREVFEKGMDTAKDYGSVAIGAAQFAGRKTSDLTGRSRSRLHSAVSTMAKRAREDPEYRRSLDTLFNLIQKWLEATGNLATAAAQSMSLESLVNDPTPEKHLIHAICYMNKLVQNMAGGKSLDDLQSALRMCIIDIRNDADSHQWFKDYIAYARRTLENVGDNDIEKMMDIRQSLRQRWNELTDVDSDKGRKWKEDFDVLRNEVREFQERMENDKELQVVRKAHAQLGRDIEETLFDVSALGLQAAVSGTSWLWTDLFNVYLPRFVCMLKTIPIPRMEYVDEKIEFVLEDLDISSVGLLPGHVFIRNITDVEITAPSNGKSTTAVGTLTQVHMKGLQLKLSQLSFYYRDLTAAVGPAEFTGLAEITLPSEGVNVDIKIRTIPNTPEGLSERVERQRFLRIDLVAVNVSDDVDVRVTKSNHPVLLSMFRPLITTRLRGALQTTLSANIRGVLEGADALAWDTLSRAEIFEDAGVTRGQALATALWSELGRLQRTQGGLSLGWGPTGTGVVREGNKARVAIGAEPQVLGPEKHGPKGMLAQPLKERARDAGVQADVDVNMGSVEVAAKDIVGQAREGIKAGVHKARTFEEIVAEKQKEEERTSGWESRAFDV